MFKAIVFMSVIVSLAYSAPYGGYGSSGISSSSYGGLGKVGISFESGKEFGVGLEDKGMEMSFGNVQHMGLGEVRHASLAPISSVGLGVNTPVSSVAADPNFSSEEPIVGARRGRGTPRGRNVDSLGDAPLSSSNF